MDNSLVICLVLSAVVAISAAITSDRGTAYASFGFLIGAFFISVLHLS